MNFKHLIFKMQYAKNQETGKTSIKSMMGIIK